MSAPAGRATDFVIVQHAQKAAGAGDVGLTPLGSQQAAEMARRLAAVPFAAVYASPLRRARETAEPLARLAGRRVVEDARLGERMNWDGEDSLEAFLAEWARATRDRVSVPRWGVSSAQAGAWFAALLDELGARHPGQVVALVGHGGATVDLLRTLYGDEDVREAAADIIDQGVPPCRPTHLRAAGGHIEPVAVASERLKEEYTPPLRS